MLEEASVNHGGMPYADQKEKRRNSYTNKRSKMESSENDELTSPRVKRPNNQDAPPDDISSIESCIKFLVSSSAAGSIIGKGGSTISEFQAQSAARIQLSRTREYFPGTNDRIILLSGTVSSILTALHLILSKIAEDGDDQQSGSSQGSKGQVRLVIPNAVCGAIIGKGGATIRSFVEDSGASIKLSSQDQALPGVSDRLVTIGGTLEQQLRAVALIVAKISEDPGYASYATVPLSYTVFSAAAASGGGVPMYGSSSPGYGSGLRTSPYPSMPRGKGPSFGGVGVSTTITVAVPDEHVGAMVGRGGRTILEIQQITGVHIKLSDRGDFVEGTNHRKVTITGSADGVVAAQQLISQKVGSSSDYDVDRDYDRERTRDRDRPRDRDRAPRERDRDRDRTRDRERSERDRDRDRDRLRR